MGSSYSSYYGHADDDEIDPTTGLSGKEKRLVKETWAILRPDPINVGIAIMTNFFKKHPSYQNFFQAFKDVPLQDLPKNKRFQVHCNAVVNAINTIVDSLDDPDLLVATLTALGEKHHKRGQTKEQFNNLKIVLAGTLKDALGSKWTPEVSSAWTKTLDTAYSVIFQAMA